MYEVVTEAVRRARSGLWPSLVEGKTYPRPRWRKRSRAAVTFACESPYPEPSELFEDMFANPIPLD